MPAESIPFVAAVLVLFLSFMSILGWGMMRTTK